MTREDVQKCGVQLPAHQARLTELKPQKVVLVGRIETFSMSAHAECMHHSFLLKRRRDREDEAALYLRPTPTRKMFKVQ